MFGMMRCCLLMVLLFSLPGWAQKFSAADLRLLNAYSTGIFTNDVQAKADTHFLKASLKVQPIWPKRKDGVWLFVEKTDTGRYYQVWHFYLQDDTTVLLQFLNFKVNQQAVQLSQDIKQQSKLYMYNLLARHGCELYMKKNKTGYVATSAGKDCLAKGLGIEYTAFNISLTKNTIVWQENSFDKDDRKTEGRAYNYSKQVKSLK
jgi:hypothetical protein